MSTVPSFIQQLLLGPDDVVLSQGELVRLQKCLWAWRRDLTPEERHKLLRIHNHNWKWPQKVESQLQRLRDCVRMLPQLAQPPQIDWEQVGKDLAESSLQTSSQPTSATPHAKKGRRSTQRGGAVSQKGVEEKFVAALLWHHQLDQDDFTWEPIGVRTLAKMAEISLGSASNFFKKYFGSYLRYRNYYCRHPDELRRKLQNLDRGNSREKTMGDRVKYIQDGENTFPNEEDE